MNRRRFLKTLAVALAGTSLVGTGVLIKRDNHRELFSLIRRVYPELNARELIDIQPMSGPPGIVFHLDYKFQ